MLTHIHIRDLAIVDELELELGGGMIALTGETGAGKSILVDAMGLALGDRADSAVVRHGRERAEISASFDLSGIGDALAWLQEREFDAGEECVLRRVVGADGRSRAYINGQPAPIQALRELGDHLVDIHGQHEHQSLLKRDIQRQLLDDYAGHEDLLAQVLVLYQDWQRLAGELEHLRARADSRAERLDLLRFQVQELDALGLTESAWAELNEEHARLAHAGRLAEAAQLALQSLYDADETSAHSLLSRATRDLGELVSFDRRLEAIIAGLDSALIQLDDALAELRRYSDGLDLDPARLEWVEQRLGAVVGLARKHRVQPEQLPAHLVALRTELTELEQADQRLDGLEAELGGIEGRFRQAAEALGRSRAAAARELGAKVTEIMHGLGMGGGRFEIEVSTRADARFTPHGLDDIQFLVTANPGQPLRPLAKVASGGELSRISLAIQVITARALRVPTLVFDEVDTGIGGGVAEVVGRQLRALGEHRQVLCVTHLPQVAAQAHAHLVVSKHAHEGITRTGITPLDADRRVHEIARMLGGIELTEQTLAHASEMIERAQHG
jgi:DNA repair protein RecN (Recombination protein N)